MIPGDGVLVRRRELPWHDPRQVSMSYRLSTAIQSFTGSAWNHVAGVIQIYDTLVLVEAEWDAVKIRPLDFYAKNSDYEQTLVPFPGSDTMRREVCAFWAAQIFETYDKGLIARMAKTILTEGIEGLRKLRIDTGDDFWICSELLQEGWKRGGVRFARSNYIYVPGDFADLDRIVL